MPLNLRGFIYDFTTFTKNNKVSINKILQLFERRKINKESILNELLFKAAYKLVTKGIDTKKKIIQSIYPDSNSTEEIETRIGLTELTSINIFSDIFSKSELEEIFKCYEIINGKIQIKNLINDVFIRLDLVNDLGKSNIESKINFAGKSAQTKKNIHDERQVPQLDRERINDEIDQYVDDNNEDR